MLEWILLGVGSLIVFPGIGFAIYHGAKGSKLEQEIMALDCKDGFPYNSMAKRGGGGR